MQNNFFTEMHSLELVYSKYYLISQSIHFEAIKNGVKSISALGFNRSISSSFLIDEKCKPYEIYRR